MTVTELALVQQYVDIEDPPRLAPDRAPRRRRRSEASSCCLLPAAAPGGERHRARCGAATRSRQCVWTCTPRTGACASPSEADQAPAAASVAPRGHGRPGQPARTPAVPLPDAWTLDAAFPTQGDRAMRLSLPLRHAPARARPALAERRDGPPPARGHRRRRGTARARLRRLLVAQRSGRRGGRQR